MNAILPFAEIVGDLVVLVTDLPLPFRRIVHAIRLHVPFKESDVAGAHCLTEPFECFCQLGRLRANAATQTPIPKDQREIGNERNDGDAGEVVKIFRRYGKAKRIADPGGVDIVELPRRKAIESALDKIAQICAALFDGPMKLRVVERWRRAKLVGETEFVNVVLRCHRIHAFGSANCNTQPPHTRKSWSLVGPGL